MAVFHIAVISARDHGRMINHGMFKQASGNGQRQPGAWAMPTRALGLLAIMALLSIVAVSGLRFINLGAKVYWHDEAYSSLRVFGHTGPEYYANMFDGKVHAVADVQNYQHLDPERGLAATLTALASRPEHPPLYYFLARLWAGFFQDPVVALRSLSALFGLLLLPAVYWFARELFANERVSWATVALAASSPLYLIYSQEARQYALWMLLTALSCAALLHVLRTHSRRALFVYALTVALGLYAHIMAVFIIVAHVTYLFLLRDRYPRELLKSCSVALALGGLAFMPWLVLFLNAIPDVSQVTGWMWNPVSTPELLRGMLVNVNRLFFDFTGSEYLVPVSLGVAAVAVGRVWHRAPESTRLLPLLLLTITGLAVLLPDLLAGGRRSLETRYLLPALLVLGICVAYLIGTGASLLTQRGRAIGVLGALLIAGGVYSQLMIVSSSTWWNKSFSANNAEIAAAVNAAERPLLIAGLGEVNPGELLSLSYLLDNRVQLLLLGGDAPEPLPQGYSRYFVLSPAWSQLRWPDPAYTTRKVVDGLGMWELIPRDGR